jgi:ketosteroid isomerase-like protein
MSEENVEIVRAALAAFNRRDVKALRALLTEDAEIVPIRAALEDTAYRGPNAVTRWYAALEESWEDLSVKVEEMRNGGDRVIALGRVRGRGRASGAAVDVEAAALFRFRGGLISNLHIYTDRAKAFEAAGLSE